MVVRILKDIYVIKVPLPRTPLKNLNSYFIKGKHRNLLIDTGFNLDECFFALKNGLDELQADMNYTDIFITHCHADHCGLCNRIASENTKIFISEPDKNYLDFVASDSYLPRMHERRTMWGFSRAELNINIKGSPLKVSSSPKKEINYTVVDDGFKLNLGDYCFEAIATPGHTPGHMCLYDRQNKILFSGDHIIFDITPNISTWDGVEDSLGLYIDSLKKIKQLKVDTTLSAHRSAMGNCDKRIDELIKHHMNRISETYQLVSDFPESTAYEIASKMKWSIRVKDWKHFPGYQKLFAVGEAASHLEHLVLEGQLKSELRSGRLIYDIR